MKNLHKTALVSLFVAAAGYASAQTNLADVDLSGIHTISSTMEVKWDSKSPLVDKNYAISESHRDRMDKYQNAQRVLAKDVADAGIAIDDMVAVDFASALADNPAIESKLTTSADADANFKLTVQQWGLLSNSNDVGHKVKPVIQLRVDLIDRSGHSLWHDTQFVSQYSPSTTAYKPSQLYDNAAQLSASFNQAVTTAVNRVSTSL